MKRLRLILLGVSIVAILAMSVYLGKDYISPGGGNQQPVIQMVPAVKLTADLKRGDAIDPSKYTVIQVQPGELPKNVVQSAESMNKHYAAIDLYAGEYAYAARVTDIQPHAGKQRVAVDLTPLGAAAGKIERGQYVTVRVKKPVGGTAVNPVTGQVSSGTGEQVVDIITPTAEVAAVVDQNLQDRDGFRQAPSNQQQQQQPQQPGQVGQQAPTTYFIPKFALIWVTPQEADLITKYDSDGGLRLAIN